MRKKPSSRKTLLMVALLCATSMEAQFKISAELRPRTEYSHGYALPASEDQDPSLFTTQRTRLQFAFSNQESVKLKIVLQDVRLWGSQPQLVQNEDYATSVHEAWGEFGLGGGFSVKAGRQELVYDDQRILGSVGWAQQGRTHDVALLKYTGGFELHLGFAHHENDNRQNNYYFGPDAYKDLQFVWFHNSVEALQYSILLLNNGIPVTTFQGGNPVKQETLYSQTLGMRVEQGYDRWRMGGHFYFQTGDSPDGRDLSAFDFAIEAHKNFEEGKKLGIRYEWISGTEPGNATNQSFTPLYGTNHKFNGFMDYFYVGNHLNSVGLHDLQLSGSLTTGKVTLTGDLHLFNSHKEVNNDGTYLGTELDMGLSLPVNSIVKFAAGYSQMLASERLADLRNITNKGSLHNWAWVMVTFSPEFL